MNMENQHRKIAGYRELSQAEIDLMNEIKAHGEATAALLQKVGAHLSQQVIAARNAEDAMQAYQAAIGQFPASVLAQVCGFGPR